jgi:hypothetical protein
MIDQNELLDRLGSLSPQELTSFDRALTPELVPVLIKVIPEMEALILRFAQPAGAGQSTAGPQLPGQSTAGPEIPA